MKNYSLYSTIIAVILGLTIVACNTTKFASTSYIMFSSEDEQLEYEWYEMDGVNFLVDNPYIFKDNKGNRYYVDRDKVDQAIMNEAEENGFSDNEAYLKHVIHSGKYQFNASRVINSMVDIYPL